MANGDRIHSVTNRSSEYFLHICLAASLETGRDQIRVDNNGLLVDPNAIEPLTVGVNLIRFLDDVMNHVGDQSWTDRGLAKNGLHSLQQKSMPFMFTP